MSTTGSLMQMFTLQHTHKINGGGAVPCPISVTTWVLVWHHFVGRAFHLPSITWKAMSYFPQDCFQWDTALGSSFTLSDCWCLAQKHHPPPHLFLDLVQSTDGHFEKKTHMVLGLQSKAAPPSLGSLSTSSGRVGLYPCFYSTEANGTETSCGTPWHLKPMEACVRIIIELQGWKGP